jgi:adenylate cyclase
MAEERVKRKLSAILCADVVEYSRLMGEDEAATLKLLNTCDAEIIEPTVNEYNGRIFKRLGDGFLVEFSSAVDSVECAIAWQKQIQEKNHPLQFRIGINLGDVIEQDDDVYGDGVNIASRIEKLAESGGICISRSIFDQINKKVSLGFEYLGEQQVKNISEPVGVYKLLTKPEDAGKIIGEDKQVASKKFSSRQSRFAIAAGVLAFIVIAFFVGKFNYEPQVETVASEENMAYALPEEPSIAVMPFKAIGGTKDENLLSDGILTSITTALSKTPKLFTVDYASTSNYKGEDISIKNVAEELGVRYVLLGDLQKPEDQVRINVKLIDALTGKSLWAEKYDRSIDDLFAMQDDITMQVMKALQVELYEGEYGNVIARGTDNLEAYLKIVQGYQHWQGGNTEDDAIAQRLAKEAIDLDPEYSPAYSLLSRTLWRQVIFRTTNDSDKTMQESLDAALKALELDYSADTLSQLGMVYNEMGQFDKAIETAERGLALNPNNSRALTNTGLTLMYSGRCEEAISLFDKALRISPIPSVNILFCAGMAYRNCKQYDECITLGKKAAELGPNSFLVHRTLAECYALIGRFDEAKASATDALNIFPKYSVKDSSIYFADNEKAQEAAARINKARLMAGFPPDESLKESSQ